MVWVRYKERFHGEVRTFWKQKKSVADAKKEAKKWNSIDNPQEHLSVLRSQKTRPKNIVKKYPNIYWETKAKRK